MLASNYFIIMFFFRDSTIVCPRDANLKTDEFRAFAHGRFSTVANVLSIDNFSLPESENRSASGKR